MSNASIAETQVVYRSLKENPVEGTTPDQIKVEQDRARTKKMEHPPVSTHEGLRS
jgi:hypothetical protein